MFFYKNFRHLYRKNSTYTQSHKIFLYSKMFSLEISILPFEDQRITKYVSNLLASVFYVNLIKMIHSQVKFMQLPTRIIH